MSGTGYDVSLVLPCYNEEDCLRRTVPPLAEAFQGAGVRLQLVLVDNGSTDRTGEIIDSLAADGLPITKAVVPVNRGLGLGVLSGFSVCRGRYIGYLCADGQVGAGDVLRVYRRLTEAEEPTLAKVRRRFREDSWIRKVVSVTYNALMHVLFPGIGGLDVNGNPKILPADVLRTMGLESRDWFIDAEIMLEARRMGLRVREIDVLGRAREGGKSNVRFATIGEFVRNILRYRLTGGRSRSAAGAGPHEPAAPADAQRAEGPDVESDTKLSGRSSSLAG